MRKAFGLALVLAAAACSGTPDRGRGGGGSGGEADRSSADERAAAPAGIAPTAAPGVAFNYKYAFRLPAERITAVQEEHAEACEKLGVARCRITGLYYHLSGDRNVEARLDFKLDPAIARGFGKEGIAAVAHADGLLVTSEITGTDAGAAIDRVNGSQAAQAEALKKIEAELAKPGLKAAERVELQRQAQQLRDAIAAGKAEKAEKQESLAKTPMSFAYEAGDMAPGVRRSLSDGLANVVAALEWMLLALLTLLPWAVVAGLVWWVWRRFGPKPKRPTEA
ncbi:MAG TPA: hypothetical protein VKI45_11690 [Allosphingosinicella sp.]|nr:hypothetical protein [Allosphingosinicella sp.]